MRLIKKLELLESQAAARDDGAPLAGCGLVWTRHEKRVDPLLLGPGEFIAVDVTVLETADYSGLEVLDGLEPEQPPAWWGIAERVTTDANDLGLVRDVAGAVLGRVVLIDGSLLRWEASAAAAVVGPAAVALDLSAIRRRSCYGSEVAVSGAD